MTLPRSTGSGEGGRSRSQRSSGAFRVAAISATAAAALCWSLPAVWLSRAPALRSGQCFARLACDLGGCRPLNRLSLRHHRACRARCAQRARARRAPVLEPFAFEAHPEDHCETPTIAYKHVAPVLQELARSLYPGVLKKEDFNSRLRIYNPYYCQGGTVKRLAKVGFTNVHNKNEDFYKVMGTEAEPEFDALVTNPPYSEGGAHLESALRFAVGRGKPWFMVLPVCSIFDDYFTEMSIEMKSRGQQIIFVLPPKKYNFKTPAPLPPPSTECDKAFSGFRPLARQRSRQVFTAWCIHTGADVELHRSLLDWMRRNMRLCKVAEGVAEIPRDKLPRKFKENMRKNALRHGVAV